MGEEYPIDQEPGCVAEPYGAVITRHHQLDVYSLAFQAAQKIFALSRGFSPRRTVLIDRSDA